MVKKNYIPEKGDLVWVSFDPTLGHEQKGARPALVVSSKEFNKAYGMTYLCPITSKKRNFASHICFVDKDLSGYVMVEQLRSVDWKKRKIRFIKKAEKTLVLNVKNCLEAILN